MYQSPTHTHTHTLPFHIEPCGCSFNFKPPNLWPPTHPLPLIKAKRRTFILVFPLHLSSLCPSPYVFTVALCWCFVLSHFHPTSPRYFLLLSFRCFLYISLATFNHLLLHFFFFLYLPTLRLLHFMFPSLLSIFRFSFCFFLCLFFVCCSFFASSNTI